MGRKSHRKHAIGWVAALCLAYIGVAYVAAPEYWSLKNLGVGEPPAEMVTRTKQGIAGDPVNVGIIGTQNQVFEAFALAGWRAADALTLKTAIEIGESVLLGRPYPDAPVSTLLFEGRAQDFAFERPVGTSADQRHHVRFWRVNGFDVDGRPLWVGSASFDRGVGLSHDTAAITHHIGPDIDAERDLLMSQLSAAGAIASTSQISGVGQTDKGRNGEGDPYVTDGEATIGALRPDL